MKQILLSVLLLSSIVLSAQTTIFSVDGSGSLPADWTGTNNITANDIERGSYFLLDAGNPGDVITTDAYDLTGCSAPVEFTFDLATFGSGANNSATIEVSLDGGTTFTQSYTSAVPTGSSPYISSGTITITPFNSTNVVIRLTNSGTSGKGVRLQDMALTCAAAPPACGITSFGPAIVVCVDNTSGTDDVLIVIPYVGLEDDATVMVTGSSIFNGNIGDDPALFADGEIIVLAQEGDTYNVTITDGDSECSLSAVTGTVPADFCPDLSTACPYVTGAMINSCGSSEGPNEFMVFNTGVSALDITDIRMQYGSGATPPFTTLTIDGSAAGVFAAQPVGLTITGCTNINVVTSGSIPASANVIIMYSTTSLTDFDVSAQCVADNAYVVFVDPASSGVIGFNTGGNFSNNPSSGVQRSIMITSAASPCSGATDNIGTYQGTASSQWGSNADGNSVSWAPDGTPSYNNGGCEAIPVPVELLSFNAHRNDRSIALDWATASEVNNSHFDVQWSKDGSRFQSIGKVDGAGNAAEVNNYDFIHTTPTIGINFYRLKQVDFDGSYEYSAMKSVNFKAAAQAIKIQPSITNSSIQVIMDKAFGDRATVVIYDVVGQIVATTSISKGDRELSMDVSTFVTGHYFVKVAVGAEVFTNRFIKR